MPTGLKVLAIGLLMLATSFFLEGCVPPMQPLESSTSQVPTPEEQTLEEPSVGVPSISVDKKVGPSWQEDMEQCVRQNVEFQIIVSNDGEEPLNNISVSDLMLSGLEYIPGSEIPSIGAGGSTINPVWNFPGPLAPNSSIHMKFVAQVASEGEHENCITVQAETGDGVVVNDEDCAVVEGTICDPEHKMHYPQYPGEYGWSVFSCDSHIQDENVQVADDWKCRETGLVENIRFWGSWQGDNVGQIIGFNIEIYSNSSVDEYGHPDALLWESFVTDYESQEIQAGVPVPEGWYNCPCMVTVSPPPAPEGWYNPFTDSHEDHNHNAYYQYDISDIEDAFCQQEGNTYWLSILPVIDGAYAWGWKSSEDHWKNSACWRSWVPSGSDPEPWQELYEPVADVQSLDLAFIILEGQPCSVSSIE